MTIIVDSRKRDPHTTLVPKYEDGNGHVIQYKPTRKIKPNLELLSPLARFIAEHSNDKYIGGCLLNGANVRVEGPVGSQYLIDIKCRGIHDTDKTYKIYDIDKAARSVIKGWLFPVFEPDMDESQYFNAVANAITKEVGVGGRVIIGTDIFDIN